MQLIITSHTISYISRTDTLKNIYFIHKRIIIIWVLHKPTYLAKEKYTFVEIISPYIRVFWSG